ncbi:glycosyltransferase family 4 protein, partial [Patescibacteria group bacterium]
MKIIQANKYYYLKGGAERYMIELSEWLESQGHQVAPFAMAHPKNIPSQYELYFPSLVQTQTPRISFSGLRTLGRMFYSTQAKRKMRDLADTFRPDLCHIHNIYTQ